jgi:hypothetical protein
LVVAIALAKQHGFQLPIEESEWESLPFLGEALAETTSVDHDREFEQGLDVIVSGPRPI